MMYSVGTILIRRKITHGGSIIPIGGVVKILTQSAIDSIGCEVEVVRNCKLPNGTHVWAYLYDDFVPLNLILKRKTK